MHFVAAVSQLEAELRRYDSATAIGGITGDSDFHWILLQISVFPCRLQIRELDGRLVHRIQPLVTRRQKKRPPQRTPAREPINLAKIEGALERTLVVLDLLLEQHNGVNKLLRTRRASGNVNVDWDPLIHALHERVVVEDTARGRAGTHRDDPLGFRHLLVKFADHRSHLLRDAARDDHEVGLARRRTKHFGTKAGNVETRRAHRHHFDSAAGQAEGHWPNGVLAHPVHDIVERSEDDAFMLLLAKGCSQQHRTIFNEASQILGALCARLGVFKLRNWATGIHCCHYTYYLRCMAGGRGLRPSTAVPVIAAFRLSSPCAQPSSSSCLLAEPRSAQLHGSHVRNTEPHPST